MALVHVTSENFDAEVLQAKGKVLIDFWATWCGPCQMIAPILQEIADERSDLKICKVDVDEEMELAQKFGVMSIPMLVVMEDGQIKNTAVGARPKADILALID
jgi:thioredoxin 1